MTPEVRARIFEPFYTTKSAEHGTGLGLAVVYGIVASHEGTIDVDTAPGAGSTFNIYLPLADEASVAQVIAKSADFPGGEETLLIVDDEAPLRLLLEASLSSKGYHVLTAADGPMAIVRIKDASQKIDGIVLDLNLPGFKGPEVLRTIKASRPDLKVILLSGELTPTLRSEFDWICQKQFVRKPYTVEQIGRKLRDLIEEGKLAT